MLTPDQLEALPRRFVQLWQQVEDDILQDIARRMKSLGELDPLTPTAIWQAWRLAETRAVRSNTVATLAKYTGKSQAEIKRLLETAGAQTLAADDAVYTAAGLDPPPVNQSPALLNLLNAGYRQTCGTWQNLTATTANTVTGAFEDRLSRAWGLISTGALDYSTAIRRTVDDLADTMPYITYPSGHTDTLEVAARRAVLTGVNQTCAKLQLARMEEMDCEFVEVTAHEGARPTHAVWQGRVYHRGGAVVQDGERYEDFEAATGYGTGPGLCGWNCRHNFYPFYPGVSVRNYTDERLAELDARNIPYGGGLYTRYEITQMQRALERRVRKAKRCAAGLCAPDAVKATRAGVRASQKELRDFVADHGDVLRRDVWRERETAGNATEKALNSEKPRAIFDYNKVIFSGKHDLSWHFNKHKSEFPGWTENQYLQRARELLAAPLKDGELEEIQRSDRSISRYCYAKNEFVASTADGNIRTFFRPSHGKEYWTDEHERN